jgi:hypothetical protein
MYKIVDNSGKNSVNSYDSFDEYYGQPDDSRDLKICSEFGSGDPVDMESLRSRIENPKYVCRGCGRSSSEWSSICSPERL